MRTLALVLVLLPAGVALAQSDPAADHYRAGVAWFKSGRYAEAIQEFRAADAIRPSAVLSFNIAQCYEKMADLANAKIAYQDYLRRAPNADDRAAIEATLASIDQKLAQARDTVVLVPSSSPPSGGAVSATPSGGPDYTMGITTAAVGTAALIAGIVMNAVSHQNSQSLQNDGLNGNYWSQTQVQSYHDNAQNLWIGAVVAYIAGPVLMAVGGGIVGYQLLSKPASP